MGANFSSLPMDKTTDASEWEDYQLGVESEVDDIDPRAERPALNSGRKVCVRLVRNGEAATALTPGQAVKLEAGSLADVNIAGAGDLADGFVSPYVTTVPVGYAVQIVTKGPTEIQKAAGSFTVGDLLVTAASGRLDQQSADYSDDQTICAQLLETSAAAAGTLVRALANCIR